jgi:hypothetical protein
MWNEPSWFRIKCSTVVTVCLYGGDGVFVSERRPVLYQFNRYMLYASLHGGSSISSYFFSMSSNIYPWVKLHALKDLYGSAFKALLEGLSLIFTNLYTLVR